ncbi:MAG: 1,4-dihydroxy-2-naphthoate polyprenyltransferase [Negativicutes bacterium]|nr:1,4-dihydroxy-2-naphthoate polyprenyltransferase [Negativicutes bacterium]
MQIQVSTDQMNPDSPAKSKWNIGWRLLRPHTLTASFIPVIIGTVLALPFPTFRIDLFAVMLLASILIQVSTNIFNEYFDYVRGLDHAHSIGIAGVIVRDGIAPAKILAAAKYVLAVALLLGFYLCYHSSWWLFPVGLCCIAVGYLYSGGPYPISATPFGELAAGICMGLVIIVISFFIQTGAIDMAVILVSLPSSVLIGAILMANNIRDLQDDKKHGRKTLAILLGRKSANSCLIAMFILSYAWILFLIAKDVLPLWSLLSFVSLPKAVEAARTFRQHTTQLALMPAMVATAQTNTLFGFFLALGIFLHYLYPWH